MTINSHKLDESVKAPGRPPQRIKGLTQFLVDLHYKKFGVYTKSKLFEFWKEHVSVIYRRMRTNQQRGAVEEPMFDRKFERSVKGEQSFGKKGTLKKSRSRSPKKANEDLPPYEENANYEQMQMIDYSRLYEMDVAYTIQVDLDEENDEAKKNRFIKEQEAKAAYEKRIRDDELGLIKWAIEAYYAEVKELLMASDEDLDKQDELFKKWHHKTADWLLSTGANLASTKLNGSLHIQGTLSKKDQENKEPNSQKTPEEIAKNLQAATDREKLVSA